MRYILHEEGEILAFSRVMKQMLAEAFFNMYDTAAQAKWIEFFQKWT